MRSVRLTTLMLLIAASLSLSALQACAGVIATVIPEGTNPKDNVSDSTSGFTAYLFRLSTDDGSVITGIDAGGGVTNASNGIFGPLLQNWDIIVDGSGNTTERPTPVEPDQFTPPAFHSIDSHILVPDASRVDVNAPVEDNSGVNPPGSPPDFPGNNGSDFGEGSFLKGTFNIQGAQSSSVDFAYVVLPTGATGSYSMDVTTSNNAASHLAGVVPEPGTAGLFMAGLGLLFGRRKK